MAARRTTTINHAFAAAIAPFDTYDEGRVRQALEVLGQDPDADLLCAYCGVEAETWDHVYATVKSKKFSGQGHRIGNLLPCCKPCNSKKGNKDWRLFLQTLPLSDAIRREREIRIDAYLSSYSISDTVPEDLPEYRELQELRNQVLEIFRKADVLAGAIRSKVAAR
jgi:hypothetical protein